MMSHLNHSLRNSSAHGFQHIGRQENTYIRIFWVLVVIISLSSFTFHLSELTKDFLAAPTSVSERPKGIRFQIPDIYVCPSVPLAESYLVQLETENSSIIEELRERLAWIEGILPKENVSTTLMTNLLWQTIPLNRFYQYIGHRLHQTFVYLNHPTVGSISLERYIDLVPHPRHLSCFRMRLPMDYFNSTEDFLQIVLFSDVIQPKHSSLTLYGFPLLTYRYFGAPNFYNLNGFTFYFTPPNIFPHPATTNLQAIPRYATTIQLKMSSIKLMSKSGAECSISTPRNIEYWNSLQNVNQSLVFMETYYECAYNQRHRALLKKCGCLMHGYLLPLVSVDKVTYCFDLQEIARNVNNNLSRIKEVINQREHCLRDMGDIWTQEFPRCQKRHPCTMLDYQATWSMSEIRFRRDQNIDRKDLMGNLEVKVNETESQGLPVPGWRNMLYLINSSRNPDYALRNLVKIFNYPQEIRGSQKVESWFYTSCQFFSDIGGILGLYLGASLLTFCEIVQIIDNYRGPTGGIHQPKIPKSAEH